MNAVIKKTGKLIPAFLKWVLLGLLVGSISGLAGSLFSICLAKMTATAKQTPWLIYLLPIGGLAITALYRCMKQPVNLGIDRLFTSVEGKSDVPIYMAPLIFISTLITHLFSGSAGREGAALQLGGSLAYGVGRILHLPENDRRTMVIVGMSGLFAALFQTPMTAAVFVMEVFCTGQMAYSCMLPSIISAVTGYGIATAFHLEPEVYRIANVPALTPAGFIRVFVLAVLCALLSIAFTNVMHKTAHIAGHIFKDPFIRAFAGGAVIVILTLIVGSRAYNGSGALLIEEAVVEGHAKPWDFVLKLLFTAITLGCGFKGGEIVPTFAVGATFGCVVGPLLGMDAGFAAAIALTATFCGNTNCPIASILLAIELFGGCAMPLFATAVAVCYILSANYSLYHEQRITHPDLKLGIMFDHAHTDDKPE